MAGGKQQKKSAARAGQTNACSPQSSSASPVSGDLSKKLSVGFVFGIIVAFVVPRWYGRRESKGVPNGGGCWPLANNSWLVLGERNLVIDALPPEARAYICYDGRAATALTSDELGVSRDEYPNSFSDTAVVLVENFLTDSEVKHFQRLVKQNAKPTAQPGYFFRFAKGQQYPEDEEDEQTISFRDDPVFNELEARIAAVTGVETSGEESPLQLSLDTQGKSSALPNFHHDKNHGLVRYVTSLIYLNTPEMGGETIFPALPFAPGGPVRRPPQLQAYAEQFRDIVTKQITQNKKLSPRSPWPDVQVSEGSALQKQLAKRCPAVESAQAADDNAIRPLAVQPIAGRAIFFWHEVVGGSHPLYDVFHAGCPVVKGEKLALQKFKNFAKGTLGCEFSEWCRKYF